MIYLIILMNLMVRITLWTFLKGCNDFGYCLFHITFTLQDTKAKIDNMTRMAVMLIMPVKHVMAILALMATMAALPINTVMAATSISF